MNDAASNYVTLTLSDVSNEALSSTFEKILKDGSFQSIAFDRLSDPTDYGFVPGVDYD